MYPPRPALQRAGGWVGAAKARQQAVYDGVAVPAGDDGRAGCVHHVRVHGAIGLAKLVFVHSRAMRRRRARRVGGTKRALGVDHEGAACRNVRHVLRAEERRGDPRDELGAQLAVRDVRAHGQVGPALDGCAKLCGLLEPVAVRLVAKSCRLREALGRRHQGRLVEDEAHVRRALLEPRERCVLEAVQHVTGRPRLTTHAHEQL